MNRWESRKAWLLYHARKLASSVQYVVRQNWLASSLGEVTSIRRKPAALSTACGRFLKASRTVASIEFFTTKLLLAMNTERLTNPGGLCLLF